MTNHSMSASGGKKIKITIKDAGGRLDRFLAEKMKPLSRSQIQKLVNGGLVLLNGKISTSHCCLKEADVITIKGTEAVAVKKTSSKHDAEGKEKAAAAIVPKLEIIAETDEYLVVNKPAGLIVHGAAHIKVPTLVDALLQKYPKIKKVGEDPDRPGIMHRLDKDVSGLMVIAKTQDAFDNLKRQFQERTMSKQYVGLVYGKVSKEHDVINFPIERSTSGHKMAAKPVTYKGEANPEGKTAVSEFFVEKRLVNYTLLRITIKTGRTHQIRAHMSAYGHPLVGDALYGTARSRIANKKLKISRVFLVANKLAFTDLAGERREFEIDMTAELKKLLGQMK